MLNSCVNGDTVEHLMHYGQIVDQDLETTPSSKLWHFLCTFLYCIPYSEHSKPYICVLAEYVVNVQGP